MTGREPGWYKPPGESKPKYWDGSKWTERKWGITNPWNWVFGVVTIGALVLLVLLLASVMFGK